MAPGKTPLSVSIIGDGVFVKGAAELDIGMQFETILQLAVSCSLHREVQACQRVTSSGNTSSGHRVVKR